MPRLTPVLTLLAQWQQVARSPDMRDCLAVGFLVDWAFALVFLVGLQVHGPAEPVGRGALAGYALAAYGAAKLAVQATSGPLLERLGPGWGLRLGLATVLAGMAVLALAARKAGVLAGASVYGAGAGLSWPSLYALASVAFPYGERGRLNSGLALASVVALAAGMGTGVLLPEGLPLAAVAAPAAVAILLAMTLSRHLGRLADHAPLEAAPLSQAVGLALRPASALVSLLLLLQTTAAGSLVAVFRPWGRELLGVSFHTQALLLAPAALAGGSGLALGGPAADRVGRLPVMAAGMSLAGAAALATSSLGSPLAAAAAASLGGVGMGLAAPTFGSLAMDVARWWGRDALLAWFLAVEGAGHALGPALSGLLESTSGPAPVLRLAAGLFLACAAVALAGWRAGWQELGPALATSGGDG
jgi:MFS family permease